MATSATVIDPQSLQRWNTTLEEQSSILSEESLSEESTVKFPYDEKLNRKLILW